MSARSLRSIPWLSVTLVLLALLAALPLWTGPGLVNTRGGGDSPFLFFRLQQLMTNLRDGVFPARWMPDAAYGLGYPFFNYYAALPYYLGALFNLIGFDLLVSIKLVQTLGFGLAAWGMYRWADRHTPTRSAAWLIAVAYTFAPFHLINVYVRGDSLSEFYAFVFYPLILLSIDRVIESPRSFGWLALSYGGLIMTHNVSALIFSPFILLYAAIALFKSKVSNQKSTIVALIGGLLLSFALSGWFWLPALGEANLVQLDNQTTGYFNYAEHFRSANLIQNSIGFDYSIAVDAQSTTPFAMGLAQAIETGLGLIALIATWRRARDRSFRAFVVAGLIVSTAMITPLSTVLWDTLPLLPLTQFPWRFLSIQALFASLTIGYLASCIVHPASRVGLSIAVGLTLAAAVLLPLRPDYLPIRADEITPDRLQLYEAFTGNIGTTIRAEYLPRTTIPRPYTGPLINTSQPPYGIVSQGDASAVQIQRAAIRQQWAVIVNTDTATLAFPLLYWPGWTAAIDGQTVEAHPAPDLGYIQIEVPNGEHRVEFVLRNTPLRATGELLSFITALIVLTVLARQGQAISWSQHWHRLITPTAMLVYVIVICGGFGAWYLQRVYALNRPDSQITDLTMDFVDKPWWHHNPDGADLGTARLIEYSIHAFAPQVTISWNWTSTEATTATVSLVAPSTHLQGGPAPLIQEVVPIQPGWSTLALRPGYWPTRGLYFVHVQIGERDAYLPLLISPLTYASTARDFGMLTKSIGLASVRSQHLVPDHLDILFGWWCTRRTDANYGISLRLHDATGKVWTSLDTQPGYGFQPTSNWPVGTSFDAYTLNLPIDLPRDGIYSLDVILYRVASKQEVGRTTINGLRVDETYAWRNVEPPARNFTLPTLAHPLAVTYGDQIRLMGYEVARNDRSVTLTLAWQALRDIDQNYKVFVHLFDPATDKIVVQSDRLPRNNAYPTSRWVMGEVITDTIPLSLADVPPGSYRIAIGLFDEAGRLPISGSGAEVANQRVVLEEVIEVR